MATRQTDKCIEHYLATAGATDIHIWRHTDRQHITFTLPFDFVAQRKTLSRIYSLDSAYATKIYQSRSSYRLLDNCRLYKFLKSNYISNRGTSPPPNYSDHGNYTSVICDVDQCNLLVSNELIFLNIELHCRCYEFSRCDPLLELAGKTARAEITPRPDLDVLSLCLKTIAE